MKADLSVDSTCNHLDFVGNAINHSTLFLTSSSFNIMLDCTKASDPEPHCQANNFIQQEKL